MIEFDENYFKEDLSEELICYLRSIIELITYEKDEVIQIYKPFIFENLVKYKCVNTMWILMNKDLGDKFNPFLREFLYFDSWPKLIFSFDEDFMEIFFSSKAGCKIFLKCLKFENFKFPNFKFGNLKFGNLKFSKILEIWKSNDDTLKYFDKLFLQILSQNNCAEICEYILKCGCKMEESFILQCIFKDTSLKNSISLILSLKNSISFEDFNFLKVKNCEKNLLLCEVIKNLKF